MVRALFYFESCLSRARGFGRGRGPLAQAQREGSTNARGHLGAHSSPVWLTSLSLTPFPLARTGLPHSNACGLYVQTHGRMRPLSVLGSRKKAEAKKKDHDEVSCAPDPSDRVSFRFRGWADKIPPANHQRLARSRGPPMLDARTLWSGVAGQTTAGVPNRAEGGCRVEQQTPDENEPELRPLIPSLVCSPPCRSPAHSGQGWHLADQGVKVVAPPVWDVVHLVLCRLAPRGIRRGRVVCVDASQPLPLDPTVKISVHLDLVNLTALADVLKQRVPVPPLPGRIRLPAAVHVGLARQAGRRSHGRRRRAPPGNLCRHG